MRARESVVYKPYIFESAASAQTKLSYSVESVVVVVVVVVVIVVLVVFLVVIVVVFFDCFYAFRHEKPFLRFLS